MHAQKWGVTKVGKETQSNKNRENTTFVSNRPARKVTPLSLVAHCNQELDCGLERGNW